MEIWGRTRVMEIMKNIKNMKKSGKAFFLFMLAMLLLTVFNSGIQKMLLPCVTVEQPKSGNIYIKVRGNGVLEAGETKSVSASADGQIKELYVSVGDVVKKGQQLILTESVDDLSLETAQTEKSQLEDEYEKVILEQSVEYGVDSLIIQDAKEQLELAMSRLERVKSNRAEYDENEVLLENEKEALATLKKELESAKNQAGLDASGEKTEQTEESIQIQSVLDYVDTLKKNYENKEEEIQNLQSRQEILSDDGIDVDEARLDLNQKLITLKQYLLDEKKSEVDFSALTEKLDDKKAEIEQLNDEGNYRVLADSDGVIREILCVQGEVIQKNQTVILLSPLQTSYRFSFEINKSLADYVSVGDEAKVLNVWDEDVSCKLINIKASGEAPDKCIVLEFSAEGEKLAIGQNIAVSVGETKKYYDTIIPQNAVNEDNEGSFVFVLRTKNSAFGTRYYVERVSVQVLESDETQVAVLGDLSENDYIVTLSTEALEDYGKVRLVD